MPGRSPPRKVTYFEPGRSRLARKTIPVSPHLARNTIIESTFNVGRRFRCTMRIDCGRINPGTVIRPILGHWQPRVPEHLDKAELADWLVGRNAVYQLAAMTIGTRLAVAHAWNIRPRQPVGRTFDAAPRWRPQAARVAWQKPRSGRSKLSVTIGIVLSRTGQIERTLSGTALKALADPEAPGLQEG